VLLDIRIESRAVFLQRLWDGEGYQGMLLAQVLGLGGGIDNYLSTNFLTDGPFNFSRLSDPRFEELVRSVVREGDQAKRQLMVQEIDERVTEQAYVVPMRAVPAVRAHRARVQGFRYLPNWDLGAMLEEVWVGEGPSAPGFAIGPQTFFEDFEGDFAGRVGLPEGWEVFREADGNHVLVGVGADPRPAVEILKVPPAEQYTFQVQINPRGGPVFRDLSSDARTVTTSWNSGWTRTRAPRLYARLCSPPRGGVRKRPSDR
jgi:hypothetical protein